MQRTAFRDNSPPREFPAAAVLSETDYKSFIFYPFGFCLRSVFCWNIACIA